MKEEGRANSSKWRRHGTGQQDEKKQLLQQEHEVKKLNSDKKAFEIHPSVMYIAFTFRIVNYTAGLCPGL